LKKTKTKTWEFLSDKGEKFLLLIRGSEGGNLLQEYSPKCAAIQPEVSTFPDKLLDAAKDQRCLGEQFDRTSSRPRYFSATDLIGMYPLLDTINKIGRYPLSVMKDSQARIFDKD
jgi:hypothetical protein